MKTDNEIRQSILQHESEEELRRAKVGIIALIDEITGYQKVRPRDDLKKIYKSLK